MTPKITISEKDTLFCFNNKQANFLRRILIETKQKDTLISLHVEKIDVLEKEANAWELSNKNVSKQLEAFKSISDLKDAQILETKKQVDVQTKKNKKIRIRNFLHKTILGGIIIILLLI